ncbi:MAG: transcription antitermination factor NusB [Thermoguttaceae bacterium]|nr:transcription antitermination factor NusB [Thermoguttaceae bacterium]
MTISPKKKEPTPRKYQSFSRMVVFQILCQRDINRSDTPFDDEQFIVTEVDPDGTDTEDSSHRGGLLPVNTTEELEGIQACLPPEENDRPSAIRFARDLREAALAHREEIDQRIADTALNWSLSRMTLTDRNILRLALAELLYFPTPVAIVIDEAIGLAKSFGSENSASFVNGILGKIVDSLPPRD